MAGLEIVPASLAAVLPIDSLSRLLACSVCFGDPNSAMSKGLTMGVLFLVVLVVMLLAAFAWFFITLWRRAAEHQRNGSEAPIADSSSI